jgi:hypothetical protein
MLLQQGYLTENVCGTNLHLIPKKGDLTVLKNWHPISQLNCFYKIITRVIAMCLRKVMDKTTGVAHKGFSGIKYCQEVLIGVIDSINSANAHRKAGDLISIDIRSSLVRLANTYSKFIFFLILGQISYGG